MFSRPITERSKAKPMQSRITFDTKLKIALKQKLRKVKYNAQSFKFIYLTVT